jgi:glycine dehydrogenase
MASTSIFAPLDTFARRHIGPNHAHRAEMLKTVGLDSLEHLEKEIVPAAIRLNRQLSLPSATRGEAELLAELKSLVSQNKLNRSFIGQGYYNTHTPGVILRNITENPGWYTSYTPYQAEISQGRMESLLNYQTMIGDLTGLPYANASLLDEATAAAEALSMTHASTESERAAYFVADDVHPQTLAVVRGRAEPLGIKVHVGRPDKFDFKANPVCGALIQYPNTYGFVEDYSSFVKNVHDSGALVVCATDLLALTLLKPPGEWGADIAVGSAQRFGVPVGYGGPHAGFLSCGDARLQRKMPGRIIGVSRDARGQPALRMALQTREQHIRREKATSNICTAQALLANMAAMYGVYHGPEGLRRIATRTHQIAGVLRAALTSLGHDPRVPPRHHVRQGR